MPRSVGIATVVAAAAALAMGTLAGAPVAAASPVSQYASSAVASSNAIDPPDSHEDWAAWAATGAPNQTECGDLGPAWASENGDTDGVTLALTFETAVVPSQIKVWMPVDPRALVKVEVRNGTGAWETVFSRALTDALSTGAECTKAEPADIYAPHVLTSSIADLPSTPVNQVRLTVNEKTLAEDSTPWAGEIDAVQLTGSAVAKPSGTASVTGTGSVGSTLTASKDISGAGPISYAYQWQRSANSGQTWANIANADEASYTVAVADAGKSIRVVVKATNAGGQSTIASAKKQIAALQRPSRPTIKTITANSKRVITVTWAKASASSSAPVTGYTLTCTLGSATKSIDVDGLTARVAATKAGTWSCTVTAQSIAGATPSASDTVKVS